MAIVAHICERCGAESGASANQSIGSSGAMWTLSFRCRTCGYTFEADCSYDTPEYIRNAILESGGVWGLKLAPTGADRLKAIKILREALHMSLEDVARLKAAVPGLVLQGTRLEMQYLQIQLAETGITSTLERIG